MICKICGKEFFEDWRKSKKAKRRKLYFCSPECSHSRTLTEETKKKISYSLITENKFGRPAKKRDFYFCKKCKKRISYNTDYSLCKQCVHKTKEYRKKQSLIATKNMAEGKIKPWQSRSILSYPEKFFIKVLENNNLINKCITNYPVKKRNLGIESDANYFLDFYFPELKLDLEVDGKQHKYEDRVKSDKKRDSLLKSIGIKVYRIKWKNPNSVENKKYVKKEIDKLLNTIKNIPTVQIRDARLVSTLC
jgi:very-short-patch-repair endonuclease